MNNQLSDAPLVQIRTASMARDLNYYVPSRHIFLDDKKTLQTTMMVQKHLPYVMSFFVPSQETLRQWLMDMYGMYIELIIDGWGDDDNVQNPGYRVFIWRNGKRRPHPHEDLGMSTYSIILEDALETCLEILLQETQPKNRHLKDREYNRI